jgi:hypothetical protein
MIVRAPVAITAVSKAPTPAAHVAANNVQVVAVAKSVGQSAVKLQAPTAFKPVNPFYVPSTSSLTNPNAPTKKLGRVVLPTMPARQGLKPAPSAAAAVEATENVIAATERKESAAATASANARGLPPPDQIYQGPAYQDPGSAQLPAGLPGDSTPWTPPEAQKTGDAQVPDTHEPVVLTKTALAVSALPAVVAPSFFHRLLVWLHLVHDLTNTAKTSVATASIHGESNTASVKKNAESVVRRVRSGDQNAMAIMALVRDNAAAGESKAKLSLMYMRKYIEAYPIDGVGVQMGSEDDAAIQWELGG